MSPVDSALPASLFMFGLLLLLCDFKGTWSLYSATRAYGMTGHPSILFPYIRKMHRGIIAFGQRQISQFMEGKMDDNSAGPR